MKYHIEKNTVQETLVIPLFGRLVCSEHFPELFSDPEAKRICDSLDYDFAEKRKKMEARQIQMEQENRLLRQAEELSLLRDKANGLREELIRRMEVFQKVPSLHNESTGEDFTITLSKKDWKEIETLLNNQYDQFTHRLRKAVPALITADIQFCCLLKINVSMQDIANIYHINRESVSRRKQRIKSKIGNDLLQGLTLDEFIQRF